MRTFLLACGVAALAVIHVQPQGGGAWFGVVPPFANGDPHGPVVDLRTVTAPAARVPGGEERYTDLTGGRIRRDLETIVGFSKAEPRRRRSRVGPGDRISGRTARRRRGPPSSSAPPACRTCRCSATRPARRCGGRRTGRCASSPIRPTARAPATSSSNQRRADQRIADPRRIDQRAARASSARSPTRRSRVDVRGKVAVQHLKPRGGRLLRTDARPLNARASWRSAAPSRFSTSSSRPPTCTCATSATAARRASTSARPTARFSKGVMKQAPARAGGGGSDAAAARCRRCAAI